MAEIITVKGYNGTSWAIDIGSSDRIAFCGSAHGDGVSVGGFQDSTHKSDGSMSADGCTPDHMRNCKYVAPTQVSLMGAAAVALDAAHVGLNDCSMRIAYQNDAANTALSNVRFYYYDGSNPATAPTGVKALAFERGATAINKDRVSDTPGDGGAWDSTKGVGGSGNALICEDQASSSQHNFYIGVSNSPLSSGLKTALKMRLEFDAQ